MPHKSAAVTTHPSMRAADGAVINGVTPFLFIALASGISGCGQQNAHETTTPNQSAAAPKTDQEEQAMHATHRHHHAFADPAELAKKWNNSERDQWQHPEEIVAALALKPGATVADIGAGTGYLVAHLSRAVGKEGTVIGIDAERAMIEYLASHRAELGPATIMPRKVGPDDPELQSASADSVLTLDTWHHVAGQESYAQKVYSGLKPGGRFVVVDHTVDADVGPPKEMRLGPEQVVKQLEAAGFRVEIVPESMPRHYMVVGHKD